MALAPHSVHCAPVGSLSHSTVAALSPVQAQVFFKVTEIGVKIKQDLCFLIVDLSQTH